MELTHGSKYNYLTIISFSHKDEKGRKYYLFKCDCGIEKIIHGSAVVSGNTKSCGCYGKEVRKNKRLPNDQGVITQIILGYKRHAERRKFKWELSFQQVSNLIQQPCHYCGEEKTNCKITKNFKEGYNYNGIDRVNSSKNYTVDNVVACCKICNYAKSNLSQKEFILWLQKAAKHTKAMATQWTK